MALYLLYSTACFSILFIAYLILLQGTTFFQYNRFYLLGAALLSLVFPILPTLGGPVEIPHKTIEGVMITANLQVPDRTLFTWVGLIEFIYYAGCAVNLLIFSLGLARVLVLMQKSRKFLQNGLYFLPEDSTHTAFSFFGKIFIHPQLDIVTQASAIAHEKVHVRQAHSLDVIFYELLCIVFWFNPLYRLAKKQLTILHEFIADDEAGCYDKVQYARVLTARAVGVPYSTVVNSFSLTSNLKRRLTMLHKTKTGKSALLRYALFIPVITAMLFFNSFTILPPIRCMILLRKCLNLKEGRKNW